MHYDIPMPRSSARAVLVILVETSTRDTSQQENDSNKGLGLTRTFRHLVSFIAGYLALNQQNELVVIALHNSDCRYLYKSPHLDMRTGVQPPMSDVCKEILSKILQLSSSTLQTTSRDSGPSNADSVESPLAAGLSMALCHIKRIGLGSSGDSRRIFCLQRSTVSQRQYIPMMNVIFAAQQAFVPIDSYSLCCKDSNILEQAANITRGLHRKMQHDGELGQHLLTFSAWSLSCRGSLYLGKQHGVHFNTFCFCHKKMLHRGFVCSACLSISCAALNSVGNCMSCSAKFDKHT